MSPENENTVNVVFRTYKDGEVIALMPDIPEDPNGRFCCCYAHVGQHSAADYAGVIVVTRPSTREEIEPLKRELESLGYGVCVRVRAGRRVTQ